MTLPQPSQPLCTVPFVEVSVNEDLDRTCLPAAGAIFDAILALWPEHVVVELAGCRRMDAAAVGLLLDVHRQLAVREALLTLDGPGPRIRRIIAGAKLDRVFHIVPADFEGAGAEPTPLRQGSVAGSAPVQQASPAAPVARGRAQVIVSS